MCLVLAECLPSTEHEIITYAHCKQLSLSTCSLRHEFNSRSVVHAAVVANLIAHRRAILAELFGHARGGARRRDTPRLRDTHHASAARESPASVAGLEEELWELRRLA